MLPSSTVENYLKTIYLGTSAQRGEPRLMPMGQLASAVGVTPGTATTMVKTLAESGLVNYEPYAGVALTRAGRRLAALVLRRHRLVELFLVRVMGLRWDEVHEEAELLEHVVSDRLIDRMDEMLGRPEVDPHGDPIPDAEGVVKKQEAQSLLTCPLDTPMTVTRIIDQDKRFLRFVENHHLKPGESVEVEERDEASDSVRLRGKNDRRMTIGARAASKLLVQVARALLLVLAFSSAARAQPVQPFAIVDNSFFIEEAFNQDVGTMQTIGTMRMSNGREWETSVTQEWPLFRQRHQVSCAFTRGTRRLEPRRSAMGIWCCGPAGARRRDDDRVGTRLPVLRIPVHSRARNRVTIAASDGGSGAIHASIPDESRGTSVKPYETRQHLASALFAVS